MARPSWSGHLRFNLISVPVKGFNAIESSGGSDFHMLHDECKSRIQYKKVCPIHGEVSTDDIVYGYEVRKGEYAVVDKEERKELRAEDDRTVDVDTFVNPDAIDPVYFAGKTYYLVPDGKVAFKPFAVLVEAMRDEKRCGVCQVVMGGKNHVVIVFPHDNILTMSLLNYEDQVKKAADFEESFDVKVSEQERKLAHTLIETSTSKKFDLASYKDEYEGQLEKLIATKKTTLAPGATRTPRDDDPPIINLMDALRKSIAQTQGENSPKKPKQKKAISRHGRRRTG